MRQRIQKLVKLFFGQTFRRVRLGAFTFSQCCDLSRRLDDMWGQEDDQLGFGVILNFVFEKISEQRDVAKKGDFAFAFRL